MWDVRIVVVGVKVGGATFVLKKSTVLLPI